MKVTYNFVLFYTWTCVFSNNECVIFFPLITHPHPKILLYYLDVCNNKSERIKDKYFIYLRFTFILKIFVERLKVYIETSCLLYTKILFGVDSSALMFYILAINKRRYNAVTCIQALFLFSWVVWVFPSFTRISLPL